MIDLSCLPQCSDLLQLCGCKTLYLFDMIQITPERKNRGKQDPSDDNVSDLLYGARD